MAESITRTVLGMRLAFRPRFTDRAWFTRAVSKSLDPLRLQVGMDGPRDVDVALSLPCAGGEMVGRPGYLLEAICSSSGRKNS